MIKRNDYPSTGVRVVREESEPECLSLYRVVSIQGIICFAFMYTACLRTCVISGLEPARLSIIPNPVDSVSLTTDEF